MWCKEKFVYYSNSPGFYAIYFLRKKLFWCYMIYNCDVKIPGKEKKTIMVRNTNLVWCLLDCLFCLSKLLLLLLPWWLPPPPLLPTLPPTTGSTPGIARNFTHRFLWCQIEGQIPQRDFFSHALNIYGIPPFLGSLASQIALRIATLLFHCPLLYARPMRRMKK